MSNSQEMFLFFFRKETSPTEVILRVSCCGGDMDVLQGVNLMTRSSSSSSSSEDIAEMVIGQVIFHLPRLLAEVHVQKNDPS